MSRITSGLPGKKMHRISRSMIAPLIVMMQLSHAALANGTNISSTISTPVDHPVGYDDPEYPLNGGDTITITTTGIITTTNDGTTAVNANGTGNTVYNYGAITVTGSASEGVYAIGSGTNVISWGLITTSVGNGIWADNSEFSTISNLGLIETDSGDGIFVVGANNTITNSGSIRTTENYSRGIYADGGSNTITNSGSISTAGQESYGINATGVSNTITNSGSISTAGDYAHGIYASSGSSAITNSGSISTDGDDAHGINLFGSGNTITNSGTIGTLGIEGAGVLARGDYNYVINTGTIATSGEYFFRGSEGIWVIGSDNTIVNKGAIDTVGLGSEGIYATGSTNSIVNYGSISTSGDGSNGIELLLDPGSTGNTVVNSGTIKASGDGSQGIYIQGQQNAMTNNGLIATTGDQVAALYGNGDNNSISNLGSISSTGYIGNGIKARGESSLIRNSGSITTSGVLGRGIYVVGNFNAIENSGSVTTSESLGHGIHIEGDSNAVENSGRIFTSGAYAAGVFIKGDGNIFTNSGSVIGAQGSAVAFNGVGNTFNTLNNFLAGAVDLGESGTVNFTTKANYSKLYTFEGSSLSINGSGPVPLFINRSTQQAGTYDPTIFASSSDALADMTSTISSITPGRFNGSDKDHPLWVRGFGMASSYEGTDATLDRSYNYSGVAIGYDFKRSKDLSLGVLGGYGQTSLWANAESTQSFNTNSDDGFLGLYGQKRWKNVAVDFALYGGLQSFQQQRYVNDNLAYLGNSSANASYQGWWIAPEAGITYNAGEVNGWSFLPTARLRYAQQWMGGYTETGGGSANATVNGRNVAIGQSFVGIGTRKTMKTQMGKDTKMVIDGQVGYVYRGVVGDDTVGVTMIGQSQSLATESSSRNAVAVSAGVTLDLSSAVALKIRGDFAAGGGMQYGSGGWAGLSVKF